VRNGNWDAIVEVWRERFPEIVDGLNCDFKKAKLRGDRAELDELMKLRSKERVTLGVIVSNVEDITTRAFTDGSYAVVKERARVRLGGRKFLKPDLVAGPRAGFHGRTCSRPTLVVRTTNSRDFKIDRAATLSYRSVRGLGHVLFVYLDEMRIEHFSRTGKCWKSKVLAHADDVVSMPEIGLSIALEALYAGTSIFSAN
jgi:hypothetical protein